MTIQRKIKKLTVEYEDGGVETYEAEEMIHKAGQNYPGGAFPKAEDAFTTHQILWSDPTPLYPVGKAQD